MDCSWIIVVLNFEFSLVLSHDYVTWDYPKKRFGEEEGMRHIVLRK